MVAHLTNQLNSLLVRYFLPIGSLHVWVQIEASFILCFLYCLGTVLLKHCFGGGALAGAVSRLLK